VPVVERYVMPGSQDQSDLEIIEETFRSSRALLLKNHGVLVIGVNLQEALNNAIVVEDAAQIALISRLLGKSEKLPDIAIKNLVDFRAQYGQRK